MAALLRGDLIQPLSHFQLVETIRDVWSPRRAEAEKAIEELQEVVRDLEPPPTTGRPPTRQR
jgi:hypothetical protein